MINRGSKQWGGCAGGSNRWCARGREDRIRWEVYFIHRGMVRRIWP